MWKTIEGANTLSKRATWGGVMLAFIAGIIGLLTPVERFSKTATIISVALAFLSGIVGLLAMATAKRKEQLEEELKVTRPEIEVAIKTSEETGQLLVVIEPHNRVPFECKWLIVTTNNVVVSGLQLDWIKIIPKDEIPFFQSPAKFAFNKVVDNYVELRFDYRSIYADELPKENLSGRLIKPYNLTPDKKHCIPLNPSA
jgi:nitrate reductase NapAB chaperone NapD